MELRELAAMVKLYHACRLAIGATEPTIEATARAACTYALQKVSGLSELVEDELHLLSKKSSPP